MFCISVSFKKSPLPIRQKFAFLPEEQRQFLSFLRGQKAVLGGVVLSTCNRSEIYVTGGKEALEAVEKGLFIQKGIDRERIKTDCLYYSGKKAVRHLFQVICGLDSMVLGEDEILHQVREAYQTAVLENAADGEIHIVFQEAIHCAKLSKTGTRLSATPVSIGTLTANAVEDYLKLSEDVKAGENGTVLVIGATGKIGSIVAKDLIAKGISVIGTQRKKHQGEEIFLAQKDKIILEDFDRRYQCISKVDAIVSATSSPHYTLTRGEYEKQDSKKKRLLIDLAVPYDIDRELNELQQVTLLDIDYFSDLSEKNGNIRVKEAERAVGILGERVEETMKKIYIRDFLREWEKSGKEAEGWFWKMIYHLKKVLDSDMFCRVLDVETVVMLSHKKPDSVINVKVEFGEGEGKVLLDNIAKRAAAYKPKERVTYKMIKEYIEVKYGFKVHTAYIAEVKRELGLPMYDAPNAVEELKQPRKHPTAEKAEAIRDALKYFNLISDNLI